MHAHLAAVFSSLDGSLAALDASVESVPPVLRSRRPAPGRWSVAEVLEHVALVNQLFRTRLAASIAAARDAGLAAETGERAPVPPSVAAAMANRAAPRPAPDRVKPTGGLDAADALAALHRAQAAFRAMLIEADGLALSTVTYDHPFFGRLNIYQWAELMAGHERRHAEQIREIPQQLRAAGV
jgi:hypothetical protein